MGDAINFKSAPMGFNKSEVNTYIKELQEKIEQLENKLENPPVDMEAVSIESKPEAVHEFTELNQKLATLRSKNAELENKIEVLENSENEKANNDSAPSTLSMADGEKIIYELKDGKKKLDEYYNTLTDIFNKAITTLSKEVIVPLGSDTETVAIPPISATVKKGETITSFDDFMVSSNNSGADELSAFADFSIDGIGDDENSTPLQNQPEVGVADDFMGFAFTPEMPTEVADFMAELAPAPASGNAVNEFKKAADEPTFATIDDALNAAANLSTTGTYAPPAAPSVDDVFNQFSNFSLDSTSGENATNTADVSTTNPDDALSAFTDFAIDGNDLNSDDDALNAFTDFTVGNDDSILLNPADSNDISTDIGDFESFMLHSAEENKVGGENL
ncbi:MAG: hypothetical protein FWF76_05495 [Oscillospiraceae bacterium]|nr:hypothetical protein [Oscillospiraceae bacterium]